MKYETWNYAQKNERKINYIWWFKKYLNKLKCFNLFVDFRFFCCRENWKFVNLKLIKVKSKPSHILWDRYVEMDGTCRTIRSMISESKIFFRISVICANQYQQIIQNLTKIPITYFVLTRTIETLKFKLETFLFRQRFYFILICEKFSTILFKHSPADS